MSNLKNLNIMFLISLMVEAGVVSLATLGGNIIYDALKPVVLNLVKYEELEKQLNKQSQ